MPPLVVYITGFRQHAGKTVTSLGLISLFQKIMDPKDIGYIKPVGQELVALADGLKIDKDARIIQEFSNIPDIDLNMVSPVRLGSGFTRKYLASPDPRSETLRLENLILDSLKALSHKKVVVAEGTGHPGVGGIVGLSNAKVASLMNAEIIFLSGGGIGKALDMLEVDLSYFLYKKTRVRGIIFNKLIPKKIPTMTNYITEDLLNQKYGAFGGPLSILGFLPQIDILSHPSMKAIATHFTDSFEIGNSNDDSWKQPCDKITVISLTARFLRLEKYLEANTLVIVAASSARRIINICRYHNKLRQTGAGLGGIILTCGENIPLDHNIRHGLEKSGIPALYVKEDTAAAEKIILEAYDSTKLQVYDRQKLEEVKHLFAEYFDFDKFRKNFSIP
ncbi:MAG: AAA family ATPase [Spirochaetia bacterium]